jgi:AraC-like DNA-binding protein
MTELSATSVYHEADARHCLSVSIARRLLIRPGNSQVHIAGCNFRRLYLLAERHSVTGLQSMVANQLASLLPSGESRAAVVARQLGMSPRSLTRQLADEGTTFGEILERLRQRLAARYLADDRMSVQQIAWLLGYSEVGAFNHAYKRWTGTAPRRMRKPAAMPR